MEFRSVSARHGSTAGLRAAGGYPSLEPLEPRLLLDAVYPSVNDQYMIELINRGRADPQAEVVRYSDPKYWDEGVTPDLNEGLPAGTITSDPKQPLAFNLNIIDATTKHSDWMLATDTFSHYEGIDPAEPPNLPNPYYDAGYRMETAGYAFTGTWGWGENIAWQGTTGTLPVLEFVNDIAGNLFGDKGIPERGHRTTLMEGSFREIGIGVQTGEFTDYNDPDHPNDPVTYNTVMVTEDFALSGADLFVTGVAYEDLDLNRFYTIGEAEQGVSVEAVRQSDSATFTTTTWGSGGYSLAVPPDTYTVTLSWPGAGNAVFDNVVITDSNVKLDAILLPAVDAPVLAAASDTGVAGDNITNLDNGGSTRRLTFDVGGTAVGATVTLYAGGVPIGSATAVGATTAVTTDGLAGHDLADGAHVITAKQAYPGGLASPGSGPLAITVDTVAPTIDTWHSAAMHGATELLLEISDASFSEPRDAGIKMLVLDFSESLDLGQAVAVFAGTGQGGPVNISGITATVSARGADQGQIAFFNVALPDLARYIVRLDQVEDIAGNPLAGNQQTMTALAGDVDGDRDTDVYDVLAAWSTRGKAAGAGPGETRSDFNGDGIVTTADMLLAWGRRGRDASGFADPTLPPAPTGPQAASQDTRVEIDANLASPGGQSPGDATAKPLNAQGLAAAPVISGATDAGVPEAPAVVLAGPTAPVTSTGRAALVAPTAPALTGESLGITLGTRGQDYANPAGSWDIPIAAGPSAAVSPSPPPQPGARPEASVDIDLAEALSRRLDPLRAED